MARRDKTTADIRETHGRRRLPLMWAGKLDDCKRICAFWHNRFGACLVLDRDRLNVLCPLLIDAGFTAEQIEQAIDAYHQHCQRSVWHQRRPGARLIFSRFFTAEKIEHWLAEGQNRTTHRQAEQDRDRRRRRVFDDERQQLRRERTRSQTIRTWFESKDESTRERLLQAAFDALPRLSQQRIEQGSTPRSIENRSIRMVLGQIMDTEGGTA